MLQSKLSFDLIRSVSTYKCCLLLLAVQAKHGVDGTQLRILADVFVCVCVCLCVCLFVNYSISFVSIQLTPFASTLDNYVGKEITDQAAVGSS